MSSREEITQKYLFMALEELAKHRGSIKKGDQLNKCGEKNCCTTKQLLSIKKINLKLRDQ